MYVILIKKPSNKKNVLYLEEIMILDYYNAEELCTKIFADETTKNISIVNYTDDLNKRAFGINNRPTWSDLETFLESRCFPHDRQALKLELKQLGLTEYNPLEICKITNGRNYKDKQWLEISEVREVEYDDCCERD